MAEETAAAETPAPDATLPQANGARRAKLLRILALVVLAAALYARLHS